MESEEENESICKKRKRIPNRRICNSSSDDEQEEQREKQLPRPPLVKQRNFNISKHLEKGISTYFIYIQMCFIVLYVKEINVLHLFSDFTLARSDSPLPISIFNTNENISPSVASIASNNSVNNDINISTTPRSHRQFIHTADNFGL